MHVTVDMQRVGFGGAGNSKTRETLRFLYQNVMSVVVASDVQVILFYGTLLGLEREGDFIEGDDDVDVLIAHHDLPVLQEAVNKTDGLKGHTLGEFPRQIYQIFVGDVGPFDVYPYHLINDNKDVLVPWEAMMYDTQHVLPTRLVSFSGYPVFVPADAHRLLQDTYGVDYRTPMKKGAYNDSVGVRMCHDIPSAIASSGSTGGALDAKDGITTSSRTARSQVYVLWLVALLLLLLGVIGWWYW